MPMCRSSLLQPFGSDLDVTFTWMTLPELETPSTMPSDPEEPAGLAPTTTTKTKKVLGRLGPSILGQEDCVLFSRSCEGGIFPLEGGGRERKPFFSWPRCQPS